MQRDYESIINSLRSLERSTGCNVVEDLKKGNRISTADPNKSIKSRGESSIVESNDLSQTAADIIKKLETIRIDKENLLNSGCSHDLFRESKPKGLQQSKSQSLLPLHQQEALADELVRDITKFNKPKEHLHDQLPAHLASYKQIFDSIRDNTEKQKSGQTFQLPIIKILQPEEQRKIKLLPPPSEGEKKSLKKIDATMKNIKPTEIYDFIKEKSTHDELNAKMNHLEEPVIQLAENASNIILSSVSKPASSKTTSATAEPKQTMFEISDKYKKRVAKRDNALNVVFGENNESIRTDASIVGSLLTKSTLTSGPVGPKNYVIQARKGNLTANDYPFDTELKNYLIKAQDNKNAENIENASIIAKNHLIGSHNGPSSASSVKVVKRSLAPSPPSDPYTENIKGLPTRSSTAAAQKLKIERARGFEQIRRKSIDSESSLSSKNQRDYLGLFTPVASSTSERVDINLYDDSDNSIFSGEKNGDINSNIINKKKLLLEIKTGRESQSSLECKVEPSEGETSEGAPENIQSSADPPIIVKIKTPKSDEINKISPPNHSKIHSKILSPDPISPNKLVSKVENAPIVEDYIPVIEETINTTNKIFHSHKNALTYYRRSLNDYRNLKHDEYLDGVKTNLYEEMGIDVDPLYTKGRLYGNAVKFLLYYVYSVTIVNTLNHWKNQVEKINVVRRRKATAMLNRIARGMLARKLLKDKMENLRKQREAEIDRKKRDIAKRKWANFVVAMVMKTWCRKKVKDIRKKRYMAARHVQRIIRGFLGRRKAARQREYRDFLSSFILKIQCAYRLHLAKRRVVLFRKLKYVRETLFAISNKHKEIEVYNRRTGAIWKIIKCWRMKYLAKKKLARVMYWKRIRQITLIQAKIRQFVARRKVQRLLVIQRAIDLRRHNSAIVIQCLGRQKIARNRCDQRVYQQYLKRKDRLAVKAALKKVPLIAFRVATNRLLHFMKYNSVPCVSDVILYKNATIIQKHFRGFLGKNSFIRKRIIVIFKKARERRELEIKSSIVIQKSIRGFLSRLEAFQKKKIKMCLKLQCAYRQKRARNRTEYIRKIKLQTIKIHNMLLRYIFARRRFQKRMYMKKYGKYVIILQRFGRYSLGRKFFNDLKNDRRHEKEIADVSIMRINKMIVSMQLKIIYESINRPINVHSSLFSKNQCICNGPVQAMFVKEAAKFGTADSDALSTNRADALQLQKFAKKVEGMIEDGKPDGEIVFNYFRPKKEKARKTIVGSGINSSGKPGTPATSSRKGTPALKDDKEGAMKSKKGKGKGRQSVVVEAVKRSLPYSILFDYIKNGSIVLYKFPKKLAPVDLDLVFNSVKELDDTSINYTGFSEIMAKCAQMVSGEVLQKKTRTSFVIKRIPRRINSGDKPDQPEAIIENDEVENEKDDDDEASNEVTESRSESQVSDDLVAVYEIGPRKVDEARRFDEDRHVRSDNRFNFSDLSQIGILGTDTSIRENNHKDPKFKKLIHRMMYKSSNVQNDITMSYILKALVSFLKEEWIIDVINFLESESRNKLGAFVTRIQCMARKKMAYKIYKIKDREWGRRVLEGSVAKKVIKFQSLFRKVLGRKKAAKQAQRFLMYYIPFEGQGYWYNSSTKIAQYAKPKILQSYDCVTIPLPPTGMEYIVKCSNCSLQAVKNCIQCEDSFCKQCYSNLHSKGNRVQHRTSPISMCPYCRFQMVTKYCESCMTRKPRPGSIQELHTGTQRGMYCDSCFINVHDGCEKRLEKDGKVKASDRHMLYKTKEAYLVRHQLHKKLITDHKYEDIIQPCEECKWRAASFRCNDCVQIYCNSCLLGLHSNGGPFSKHEAERLPYFTCEMSKSYDKDYFKQTLNKKITLLNRKEAKVREEMFFKSVERVQTWWRKVYWGGKGMKMIKQKRKKMRMQATLYKHETLTIRNTLDYKIEQLFGNASVCVTDNRRDQVLRGISSMFYSFADHFIYQNKSDIRSKKGSPKIGYDCGTIAELKEQAEYGGVRLYGAHVVFYGNSKVQISCPLQDCVNIGEIVRIKTQLFRVIKCEDNKRRLTLSRKWRGQDATNMIIYKMPSYGNQDYQNLYRFKYWLYDAAVSNCLASNFLKLHGRFYTNLYNIAATMMRKSVEEEDLPTGLKWRTKSIKWFRKSLWSSNFTGGDEIDNLDLSNMVNPEDLKRRQETERKDKQAQEKVLRNAKAAKKVARQIETTMLEAALGEDGTFFQPSTLISSSVEEDSTTVIKNGEGDDEDEDDDDRKDIPDDISVLTSDTKQFNKEKAAAAASSPSNKMIPISESGSGVLSFDSKFSKLGPKPKVNRPAGIDWYATREEVEWRKSREFLMTREELAAEAHEWEECVDPLTEVVFYRHIATFEIVAEVPRSLQYFRDMKEEKEKNLRNFQEANARIKKMAQAKDTRQLLNGQRNRNGYGK